MIATFRGGPRVLIVGDSPNVAVALEEALGRDGHIVFRASGPADVMRVAAQYRPEVVLMEAQPRDEAVLDACRHLRDDPRLCLSPLLILPLATFRRADRLNALRAGVWHICASPLDLEEVALRIELYASARRESERVTAPGLVDPESGFYNRAGLARRSRELGSEAMRQRTALACVVLAAELEPDRSGDADAVERCGQVLKSIGRPSDVIGRLGPLEYIVLAPATNAVGAAQLARRFAHGLRNALGQAGSPGVLVRAGFTAVANLAYTPVEPTEILARAIGALRIRQPTADFDWLPQSELEGRPSIS